MEKSQIPLQKWLVAIYILTSHKKGISSVQLANDIGVTQKSAWFMAHRIREAFKNKKRSSLKGIVELDETYMGRKYRSEYKGLPPELAAEMEKNRKDKGSSTKGAVVALKEREGDVVAKVFDRRTAQVIKNLVKQYVEKGTTLMTDEALLYRKVLKEYKRFSVNHGKGEWVRGNVHNNGVENFWSVMKRAIYGIYHQVSYKHLQRYCDEFVFRFN